MPQESFKNLAGWRWRLAPRPLCRGRIEVFSGKKVQRFDQSHFPNAWLLSRHRSIFCHSGRVALIALCSLRGRVAAVFHRHGYPPSDLRPIDPAVLALIFLFRIVLTAMLRTFW